MQYESLISSSLKVMTKKVRPNIKYMSTIGQGHSYVKVGQTARTGSH